MKVAELKPKFFAFGGKGDVWSNTAHVGQIGQARTLCGKPMLSTNWVHIERVENVGCKECLEKYNEMNKDDGSAHGQTNN